MKVIQVIPLLTVKNYINTWQRFSNTEILYQAVIAQSVEPRQIFASISINERFKTGEGSNPTQLIFFLWRRYFLLSLLVKQDFLSHFCYILNVFTIVFFECFLCVFLMSFFSSFFTFFTYSFHYNTIQNNTKKVSTNILRLLILCRKSLSTLLQCLCLRYWRSPE